MSQAVNQATNQAIPSIGEKLIGARPTGNWGHQKEGTRFISDILLKSDSITLQHLIATSFFLPMEVLDSKLFKVSPVYCLHNHDLVAFIPQLTGLVAAGSAWLHSDCSYNLLYNSRYIGVSVRRELETDKLYLCFKLWYGKNPWGEAGTTHYSYNRRLASLYNFCNLPFPHPVTLETLPL